MPWPDTQRWCRLGAELQWHQPGETTVRIRQQPSQLGRHAGRGPAAYAWVPRQVRAADADIQGTSSGVTPLWPHHVRSRAGNDQLRLWLPCWQLWGGPEVSLSLVQELVDNLGYFLSFPFLPSSLQSSERNISKPAKDKGIPPFRTHEHLPDQKDC